MDSTKELPAIISFCSGYGGIERGLRLAGFEHRVIAYVEIEAYVISLLLQKMEAGELFPAPIWSDIKTFPAHIFRDKVDLITGGYPCQPFSVAGLRQGEEDHRHLWPYIKKHIETIRPDRLFFENVPGHIQIGLREVLGDLESRGYKKTWGIFSADEVGATHRRKRVFILGNAKHFRPPTTEITRSNIKRCDNKQKGCKKTNQSKRASEPTSGSNLSSEMGDTNSERLEGLSDNKSQNQERWQNKNRHPTKTVSSLWPARPDEPQYDWEQPRVKPRVGRTDDGIASKNYRIDRLRLLGNGVVPQTAAKAWLVLNKELAALE